MQGCPLVPQADVFWSVYYRFRKVCCRTTPSADVRFDVTSILNADLSLNEEAWEQSRPMLLTPYFALSYALSFAALSSILVHVYLWHMDEIKAGKRKTGILRSLADLKLYRVGGSWTMFTSELAPPHNQLEADQAVTSCGLIYLYRHLGTWACLV